MGYRSTEEEFSKEYRTTDRILIKNDTISKEIFKRVKPFLEKDPKIQKSTPFGTTFQCRLTNDMQDFALKGNGNPMH